ncbi:hypothetical protein J437_LFUL002327 [Ladona fulva]|uniref:Tubulin/FtsZ GTPase domain-containing protein n=1 Tax=Ladona fulva TaxID=123851 RepID=A0A8K0KBX3_LADFU|nr:hypothetical protein J437_LFUL002327 [Ladona fulva]
MLLKAVLATHFSMICNNESDSSIKNTRLNRENFKRNINVYKKTVYRFVDTDSYFALMMQMLPALAFVTTKDILREFNSLLEKGNSLLDEQPVFDYFEYTWIGCLQCHNQRRPPKFPLVLWNHYKSVVTSLPKTNNSCKEWNCRYIKLVGCHPTSGSYVNKHISTGELTSERAMKKMKGRRELEMKQGRIPEDRENEMHSNLKYLGPDHRMNLSGLLKFVKIVSANTRLLQLKDKYSKFSQQDSTLLTINLCDSAVTSTTRNEAVETNLVGQCGNQIGGQFWNLALQEYGVLNSSDASSSFAERQSRVYRKDFHSFKGGTHHESFFWNHGFSDLVSSGHQGERKEKKMKAKAILVDMEDGVVSQLLNSKYGHLFDKELKLTYFPGSGNNWAVGHKMHGKHFHETLSCIISQAVEKCDHLQGFILLCSLGGGTGSGLGSYILNILEENYSNVERFVGCVYPEENDDVITSPYNVLFATRELTEHATCVFPFDNKITGSMAQ